MTTNADATRVLVVEDNPGDAKLIQHHFVQESFTGFEAEISVTHVESLTDTLRELEVESYDCVFLDLGLPESSGLETLERTLETDPDAPVVVLTGLDDAERAIEAIQAGAQDYLVKDEIDPRTLSRSLRYAIERRKQERELKRKTDQIEFFNSLLRHDMGNDLQLIRSRGTQLLQEVDGEPADHAEDVVERTEKIIELTETIRTVLNAVTSEGGRDSEVVDLAEAVTTEAEGVRSMRDDVSVSVSTPDDVFVLAGNLLGDVLKNVMSNAVEHGGEGETNIEVTVTEQGSTASIEIADDGPGIEDPERVLERGETAGSAGGTGFGLYFVSSMLDAYNGTIDIADNDPVGTVVTIELPSA